MKSGDYKLWLMVILAFALMITAWTILFLVADKVKQEPVELVPAGAIILSIPEWV
jgi:hypothetical protein